MRAVDRDQPTKLQTKAHYVGRSLTLLLLVAVMLSIAAVLELVS
jgi:hypothetical protein